MIAVAIIGVLSMIAIPSFLRFQLRAKASVAVTNLGAIATTEEAYFTEKGRCASVANPTPASLPKNARVPWTGNADFDALGWTPEGRVHFQYLVRADTHGVGRFTAVAAGDIDNDANVSFFGYVKPSGGSGIGGRLDGSTCAGTGVYNPVSGGKSAMSVAGHCDSVSGHQVF